MKRKIWFPLIFLVLTSLACSIFGAAEKAVDVGQEAATKASQAATVVGDETAGETEGGVSEETESGDVEGDAEALDVDPDALSALESYRTRSRVQWLPDEGEAERTEMEQARTRNPQAQRLVMVGDEDGDGFEFVQIGDQAWYCGGDTCSQVDADPEDVLSGFGDAMWFDPTDVTDDARAEFVGREEVNGIQSRHYRLTLSNVEAALLAAEGDVSDVRGDAWIADQSDLSGFTVRFEMSWTEKRGERTGRSELFYELYDVNAPITIEPPEGAEKSGLPEDVPAYPDARDSFSMEGMTSFSSSDDVPTIAAFYAEALAAQGWTLEQEDDMESIVTQRWSKDDRELMLNISGEDGETSVTIMIQ